MRTVHKHTIGLVFCIAAFAAGAVAQNTYPWPTSGNVGIGTGNTSPSVPLQVFYNGNTTSYAPVTEFDVGNNSTGAVYTQIQIGQYVEGEMFFDVMNQANTKGNMLLMPWGGQVGIGTTSPGGTLNVNSTYTGTNRTANIFVTSQNNTNQKLYIGINSNGGLTTGDYASMEYLQEGQHWGNLALQADGGNVGIGTTSPVGMLSVGASSQFQVSSAGAVTSPSITFTGANGGTQTTPWTGILCGGDYAEAVNAKGSRKTYEPGDVLVIGDGDQGEVEKSAEPYSTMVAGIFATKPGVIGRRQSLLKESEEIPMAMVGIVPTKVTTENGPIHRGDLLVSSSTIGYAMKGTDRSRLVGAVIGKAMGPLESGTGVIEVLVTLQ